jgi:hypothetical protein
MKSRAISSAQPVNSNILSISFENEFRLKCIRGYWCYYDSDDLYIYMIIDDHLILCAFDDPVRSNFNDCLGSLLSSPHEQRQLSLYSGVTT